MPTLHFAHLSDIHISKLGHHHDMLSGQAVQFLAAAIEYLNNITDLDFVLFTGDLFDTADPWEVEQFQQTITALQVPYHVIPGNHDRREPDSAVGLNRQQFACRFNPQIDERPTDPVAQVGYWSIEVASGVQLIGLDSIKDDDWGGVVDAAQLAWLRNELTRLADNLVLLAVHHPLHKLAPIDDHDYFYRFVCDNGPELLALLDEHPQVKVVFSGHHHLCKVDELGPRLHVAGPALCIYPCAYRTLRLDFGEATTPRLTWQTHNAANPETIAQAKQRMEQAWLEAGFAADLITEYLDIALGNDFDRRGAVTF